MRSQRRSCCCCCRRAWRWPLLPVLLLLLLLLPLPQLERQPDSEGSSLQAKAEQEAKDPASTPQAVMPGMFPPYTATTTFATHIQTPRLPVPRCHSHSSAAAAVVVVRASSPSPVLRRCSCCPLPPSLPSQATPPLVLSLSLLASLARALLSPLALALALALQLQPPPQLHLSTLRCATRQTALQDLLHQHLDALHSDGGTEAEIRDESLTASSSVPYSCACACAVQQLKHNPRSLTSRLPRAPHLSLSSLSLFPRNLCCNKTVRLSATQRPNEDRQQELLPNSWPRSLPSLVECVTATRLVPSSEP